MFTYVHTAYHKLFIYKHYMDNKVHVNKFTILVYKRFNLQQF